jgi:serine/threonine protein kinase/tetratricopeptide (TPR) repeat protein
MSLKSSCPEQRQLQHFLFGQVSPAEAAPLEEHLNTCPRCQEVVTRLQTGDDIAMTMDFEAARGLEPGPARESGPPVISSEGPTATIMEFTTDEITPAADPPVEVSVHAQRDPTCRFDPARSESDQTPPGDPGQTGEFLPTAKDHEPCKTDQVNGTATLCTSSDSPIHPSVREEVTVPGYEILEELGRGGMGVVYKARHLRLGRLVALKMILAGAHAGTAGVARFKAEAEAVAKLHHPNIVQIFETGEHEGRAYFSLEYVEGGSLEQRIQQHPLSQKAAAELIETLARTMDFTHQRGIVHRDLKPANILLGSASMHSSEIRRDQLPASASAMDSWSRNNAPKIADFGLAKRVDDDSGQTQSGAILGTPCYMSPEQAEGRTHDIGPATDIYALGAIAYELLTRRPPFKAGNPIDTIRQVIEQEPVPPRQLDPGIPQDLETICLKCLQKEPARRYATAAELADDLRRFLQDEPIRARPTPAWERAWKWGKRRPAIVALLGLCLATVMAMIGFIIWHNVSLQGQLDKARADERLARQREQEAIEAQRLARVEAEGQKLYQDAQLATAARDWATARLHLTKALATVGAEPRLEQQMAPARALLKEVEEHLRVAADRQASQARLQRFAALRDEALFLGCLYTGMNLAANLQATREVVRRALAVYGIDLEKNARPPLDDYLSDAQKSEVLADCYQLLLILAETEAQLAAGKPVEEQKQGVREAVRLLRLALELGPPSRAYHLRQERYLRRLGDETGAQREARAAATVPVQQAVDHFLLGEEYYRRASFEEAIAEFNQVLQMRPAHFWAQYLDALCLLRLHRSAEARAQLTACLAQRADFVWIYLLRGFAHGELQAFDAAEADFQKALQMPLDANARYVLFVNRGVLRVRQDRLDDAIADLQKAIKLMPNEYQAYVNLAQAHRRRKDLNAALAQMDRAVQLEPALAHLYRLRARLHLERKEPTLALADFEQAIQRESSNSPFLVDDHVERGRLLLMEHRPAEALASLDEALQRRKDHSLGQRLRAEALFQLGRFAEAVEAYDHYLETGKPLESVYRGRGLAKAELGRYPGSIEDYTRALELDATSTVLAYRGWAHIVCEAPKLALRDFELAIQLDPRNADAYCGRGWLLATQRRYREAVRDAEEAVRRGPPTPRLLYNAARIHAQCPGDSDLRALELLRQAVALLPANQRPAFWASHIRTDAALLAIRRFPRFVELDDEMSKRK